MGWLGGGVAFALPFFFPLRVSIFQCYFKQKLKYKISSRRIKHLNYVDTNIFNYHLQHLN